MRNLVWMAGCVLLFSQVIFATVPKTAFSLNSATIKDGASFPVENTCDGKDISPEMKWTNTPKDTVSLALILSDLNAPGGVFYHWSIYNLPNTTAELAAGISNFPAGTAMAKNSWNRSIYNGPCPPKGQAHAYVFTLYALDTKLNLPDNATSLDVLQNIKHHVLSKAELTAVYSH